MRLTKCTECMRIIDMDELEELDGTEVIGCGLNKGDYMPCEDCPEKYSPAICSAIRLENNWTKTTVADLEDSI